MAKRWYVVHAYSGYEKKNAQRLKSVLNCRQWKISLVTSWFQLKKWLKCAVVKSASQSVSFSLVMCWFKWRCADEVGTWLKKRHV